MTRIYAHMVIRNEEDKFLQSMLEWNKQWFDEIHVFDDRSDDNSVNVCLRYTEHVDIRGKDDVSFVEHEGKFRQLAWNSFEQRINPKDGDWVFCIDADEFLVGHHKNINPRESLELLVEYADKVKKNSVYILRPEIWAVEGKNLMARTDGYWGNDRQVRFVRWKPNGEISDKRLGCGSVPSYGLTGSVQNVHFVNLLHFGYSIEGEAQRKFDLYSKAEDNAHSTKHIQSLLEKPTLAPWGGPVPRYWVGVQ